MQYVLKVINTDRVNRYGMQFTVQSFIFSLWQEHRSGVPILISHDSLRNIGWNYPLAVYFEPGLTRFMGIGVLMETSEEFEQLRQALQEHMIKMTQPYKQEIEQLKNLLALYVEGNEKIFPTKECLAIIEPELCVRVFPDLFEDVDKDGLIPLKNLTPIGPGIYKKGELVVFAHSFFRRSLHRINTLNRYFLKKLQETDINTSTIKIAIDRDMVGLASTYKEYLEFEYWWGPKFDDNLTHISTGVTHHEAGELDRVFHGISSTQFWWQSRDNQHIFEAEELRDIPIHINNEAKYGCRYIHSIVDVTTNKVFHLDGAIRGYSEDNMIERLDKDIAHAGKHTEYTKLWRVDGEIPVDIWKGLVSDYFRDNRLVGEYLGASSEHDESTTDPEIEDTYITPSMRYVPYSMQKGDGLNIALSFHSHESHSILERYVVPRDTLSFDNEQHSYIESWTVELAKAILRVGGSLHIPDNTMLISFKDSYINFPLISHSKIETKENIQTTINGIKLLVKGFNARNSDLVISYTLGFPIENKEVFISVRGHVVDIEEWLSTSLCIPPVTSLDAIATWGENIANHLKKTYQQKQNDTQVFQTLMNSGILLMKRYQIEDKFEPKLYEVDDKIMFRLTIPDDENILRNALDDKKISPAIAFIKEISECSNCNQNYQECNCSKILDGNVVEKVIKSQALPMFWTDRPVR